MGIRTIQVVRSAIVPRFVLVNNVASRCSIIANESPVPEYIMEARGNYRCGYPSGRSGARSLPFTTGLRGRLVHKINAQTERASEV